MAELNECSPRKHCIRMSIKGWLWPHLFPPYVLPSFRPPQGPPKNVNLPWRRRSRKGCEWSAHWNPTQNQNRFRTRSKPRLRGPCVMWTWDHNQPLVSQTIRNACVTHPHPQLLKHNTTWEGASPSWCQAANTMTQWEGSKKVERTKQRQWDTRESEPEVGSDGGEKGGG